MRDAPVAVLRVIRLSHFASRRDGATILEGHSVTLGVHGTMSLDGFIAGMGRLRPSALPHRQHDHQPKTIWPPA
jgi:hypothetical protein